MRASVWRTRMQFSARYAACMALALLGLSHNASAWHGLVHYYIGQENDLRIDMGPLCNWPDVFGLISEEFCWSHDIQKDDYYDRSAGEYGGYVKCGLPAAYGLYTLAKEKVKTWEEMPSGVGATSVGDANRASVGFAFHNLADEVVHYEFFEFPDLSCFGENHSAPEMSCDIILWYEWMVGWNWREPGGHMKYLKGENARRLVAPPTFDPSPTYSEMESLALISPYYSRGLDTLETAKLWVKRNFDPELMETKNEVENRLVYLSTKIWRQQHPDIDFFSRMEVKATQGDYISAYSWENAAITNELWTLAEIQESLRCVYDEEITSLTSNLTWANYYKALSGYCKLTRDGRLPYPISLLQGIAFTVRKMGHFDTDQRDFWHQLESDTAFCDKLKLSVDRVEYNAYELTEGPDAIPCTRQPSAPPDPPAP